MWPILFAWRWSKDIFRPSTPRGKNQLLLLWFLPRLIGSARALELFWTGRVVGAEEAERIGMVNRSVPDAELMSATYELARTIASKPQQAIRFFRRAVYQSQTMALATHLDMVSSHMAVLEDTPEHRAGIAAFRTRARGAK